MKIAFILSMLLVIIAIIGAFFMGSGGFKRMITITGVYAVCKPSGYDAVCFLDADSSNGGLNCLPLSQVGGECKK